MAKLNGKKVLITGGANGIGFHTAKEFALAGCELILTDIDGDGLISAADQLKQTGAVVHLRKTDVTNRKAVNNLAAWVDMELGGLDILINNAGIGFHAELADTPLEAWKNLIDVNLLGPLYNIHAFLPSMIERRSGQIANVSSGQAYFRLPTWGAYASIKTALGVYSEILHFELKKYNIQVTTIYPFMVQTGFYDQMETKTLGSWMSMKLLPYYSTTPQKAGRIVFDAIRRKKRVERHNFANTLGFLLQMVPSVSGLVSRATELLLAEHRKKNHA